MATAATESATRGFMQQPEVQTTVQGNPGAPELVAGPSWTPAAAGQSTPDGALSPGDKLTVLMFFVFFAILGFALVCDLLAGLFR